MARKFKDRPINSVSDLLSHLEEDESKLSGKGGGRSPAVWYRGMKSARDDLIPTFHWNGLEIKDEINMMNIFRQNAHESLEKAPTSEWEWMFLMRHHGQHSRLLDWTESPIVGLYFAVRAEDARPTGGSDAALWCLLPSRLNEWSLQWPTGSDILPMFTVDPVEYSSGENETLQSFRPSRMRSPDANTRLPAAGISIRTTRRIQAQLGVFTIHSSNMDALQKAKNGSHIWRFIIPGDKRPHIRDELRRLGITRRTLFPDLDNVAREANQSVER